ncbi:MAG: hypothetical protein PHT07_03865 [Paludibacter sp.]|nr:hypothetical protein [Paludibacter sp.]
MKKLSSILTILFLALMLGGMTSCEVNRYAEYREHRGWHHRHHYYHHRGVEVVIIDRHHRGDRDDDH